MKNNKIKLGLLLTVLNVGLLAGTANNLSNQKEIIVNAETEKTEGIIFKNKKVVIKYYDNEKYENGYDIIVETRNGTNISSEWDMVGGSNNAMAYLVGNDKESAKALYDNSLKYVEREPFQWEENYEIEGVDVPYNLPK